MTDSEDRGHEWLTTPLTDHTFCINCGEEDHVVYKLKMNCRKSKEQDGNSTRTSAG